MSTTGTYSVIDVICDTLGIDVGQLAQDSGLRIADLERARAGLPHARTVEALARLLNTSPVLIGRSVKTTQALLEAFKIVEPYERIRLADKVATICESINRFNSRIHLSGDRLFPHLRLLLEEYDRIKTQGADRFVPFVRSRLEDEQILVFSHPLRNPDYSAIFFTVLVSNRRIFCIVVDYDEVCHPITNGLYQWYDVLRVLSHLNDWGIYETRCTAFYLKSMPCGYDPEVNACLVKANALWSEYDYYLSVDGSHLNLLEPSDQHRLRVLVASLIHGLSPSAVANYLQHRVYNLNNADAEVAIRLLSDRRAVNPIIEHFVKNGIVPLEYNWSIPMYPALLSQYALLAFTVGDLDSVATEIILGLNRFQLSDSLTMIEEFAPAQTDEDE